MKQALLLFALLGARSALAQDFGLDLTEDYQKQPDGRLEVVLEGHLAGALLYVDGKELGTLPAAPQALKAGSQAGGEEGRVQALREAGGHRARQAPQAAREARPGG